MAGGEVGRTLHCHAAPVAAVSRDPSRSNSFRQDGNGWMTPKSPQNNDDPQDGSADPTRGQRSDLYCDKLGSLCCPGPYPTNYSCYG